MRFAPIQRLETPQTADCPSPPKCANQNRHTPKIPDAHTGEWGKNEAWIILEAPPDCRVFAGFKSGVDESGLRTALAEGRVAELLHAEPVVRGDVLYIPAGTVHALSPGLLLAEVQQASVQTYRLYDWGRCGTDGRSRELHIEKAMACIDFNRGPHQARVTPHRRNVLHPR